MKFLIAIDKFKESLTALGACLAVKEGVLNYDSSAQVLILPLADGGEGSLEAIEPTLLFNREFITVNNPLFEPIETFYGLRGDTAYIEMSKASGLLLLTKERQNACQTTTLGTGEMIVDACKSSS
jgi:glycerate kinase